MTALMVIRMTVSDPGWLRPYSTAVAEILADHGAQSVAFSREIHAVERDGEVPERVAIFTLPSVQAVHAFMTDEHYRPWRELRRAGAKAEILTFENALIGGPLG